MVTIAVDKFEAVILTTWCLFKAALLFLRRRLCFGDIIITSFCVVAAAHHGTKGSLTLSQQPSNTMFRLTSFLVLLYASCKAVDALGEYLGPKIELNGLPWCSCTC